MPAEQLDTALVELKRLAIRIDSEEQKTDDVTDQYVDLDARLRTLRSTEAELRALLAESRQRQRGAAARRAAARRTKSAAVANNGSHELADRCYSRR